MSEPTPAPPPPPAPAAEPTAGPVPSRRGFLVAGAGAIAGALGLRWIQTAEPEDGIPWPLRRMHEFNERVWRTLHRPGALAPTFPASAAVDMDVNGRVGLRTPLDAAAWRLTVESAADAGTVRRTLTFEDIAALPRTEMVTEFKCVEGWSAVVAWAGVTLADLAAAYKLGTRSGGAPDLGRPVDLLAYVGLETPDRQYYVGLEAEAAFHPQTLLAYDMNGARLTPDHGAPLRLVTPLKYGYKQIKRIGRLWFGDQRPADYWAGYGYDWHGGH